MFWKEELLSQILELLFWKEELLSQILELLFWKEELLSQILELLFWKEELLSQILEFLFLFCRAAEMCRRGGSGKVVWVALCVVFGCVAGCDLGSGEGGCGECALLTVCNENTGDCIAPDDYSGLQVNRVPSLALDAGGRLLVAAQAAREADVVLGVWDESEARFRYQLVDSRGEVGSELALAIGPDGHPGILYYDANQLLLRYAFYSADTQRWLTEEVDSSSANLGTSPDLVIDADGVAHAVYRDEHNRALRYAVRTKGIWRVEYVDTGKDSALDPSDICPPEQRAAVRLGVGFGAHLTLQGTTPVVAYHDADCGTLRLARRASPGVWTREVFVGRAAGLALPTPGGLQEGVGRFNALALDPLGSVAVAFFDADQGELKVALTRNSPSGEPIIEIVDNGLRDSGPDSPPQKHIVGQHLSLGFRPDGAMVVAHMNATTRQVLLSTRVSAGVWQTVALPSATAGEGFWTQLAIDANSTHHLLSANRIQQSLASPLRLTRFVQ